MANSQMTNFSRQTNLVSTKLKMALRYKCPAFINSEFTNTRHKFFYINSLTSAHETITLLCVDKQKSIYESTKTKSEEQDS